ncbi:MAG: C-GCAxxG-C-C family protein [Bacteroidota bacterium]|uniref:C_GCAxxG_C_C family protein n=1 Tax=Flagellimonas profundi TaxID=2915620 RepID=A0ABS3FBC4_9FLAO|nr:C-GCAxxG-C-C family protein [Allomuricauda profundi]MBO0340461.1 C_GCAxxG_C_C family protein [Allomuricauda profundi]MEC7770243.1 C-GCAxxG-C-C family protein [Bacteroidota bacterium]
MDTDIKIPEEGPKDGKKVFKKLRTCSRTFFYILNREFGHLKEQEERASDSLAGGIMQEGHQCGMLWGASLAIGAEAYRQCKDKNQAIFVAVHATKKVMDSFSEREHTINCRDITHCDFSSNLSMAKYFFTGRFLHCFNLAEQWAPEAVKSAIQGISESKSETSGECHSCASEVAKKMGASDEESIMVAGFAGGLGLSGAACGALAAAIWMKSLQWCREVAERSSMDNPYAKETLDTFYQYTNSNICCSQIIGKQFEHIEEHTRFINNSGCEELINVLSNS